MPIVLEGLGKKGNDAIVTAKEELDCVNIHFIRPAPSKALDDIYELRSVPGYKIKDLTKVDIEVSCQVKMDIKKLALAIKRCLEEDHKLKVTIE